MRVQGDANINRCSYKSLFKVDWLIWGASGMAATQTEWL